MRNLGTRGLHARGGTRFHTEGGPSETISQIESCAVRGPAAWRCGVVKLQRVISAGNKRRGRSGQRQGAR